MGHQVTFVAILGVFLLVGMLASRARKSGEACDYLLAGRNVPASLAALSAVATKYSGYIFVGFMGYTYTFGVSAIWILLGFVVGDFIALKLVHRPLRAEVERAGCLTFPGLISRWHRGSYRILRLCIASVSLVFLTVYAAAQLSAGGKAVQFIFGWDYTVGATIGAIAVMVYCFTGGLRASIWTDALQSLVMLIALAVLSVAVINYFEGLGGWARAFESSPLAYKSFGLARFDTYSAVVLFALGWVFNGIGTIGQPHIMVRLMAMDPKASTNKAAIFYYGWSGIFLLFVFFVALSLRLVLGNSGTEEAELALPNLALAVLPQAAVGILLAGVFASILSTADSQILSCAAILSDDFRVFRSVWLRRIATVVVGLIALAIALFSSASVFTLVVFAWAALASAIAPLVIVHALGWRPSEFITLSMVFFGIATAFAWRYWGLHTAIYECLPGIVIAVGISILRRYLIDKPSQKVAYESQSPFSKRVS